MSIDQMCDEAYDVLDQLIAINQVISEFREFLHGSDLFARLNYLKCFEKNAQHNPESLTFINYK